MTDNTFKFYLRSPQNTYYCVVDGVVTQVTEKTELRQGVASWQDTTLSFKRSPVYWATFREYNVGVKFVLDGQKILRQVYKNGGFAAQCIFQVEKLNTTTMQYELWYESDMNFAKKVDEQDYFEVYLLERGLVELVKARENTTYEIPLNDPQALATKIDGVQLGSLAEWRPGDYSSPNSSPVWHNIGTSAQYNVPMFVAGNAQIASAFTPHDQAGNGNNIMIAGNILALYNNNTYAGEATLDINNVNLAGRIKVLAQPNSSGIHNIAFKAVIGIMSNPSAATQIPLGSVSTSGTGVQTFFIDVNAMTNIPANYVLFILVTVTPPNSGVTNMQIAFDMTGSSFKMTYLSQVPNSNTKGFRQIHLFKKLIAKLTDGQYTAESDFLSNSNTSAATRKANFDNSPYNTIITSGNGLRGLENATIKTSLSDFFKHCWSKYKLALSCSNGVVRLEPLKYYFSDEVILHIDSVNSIRSYLDYDKLFNRAKVGYGTFDNNNVVGKNEFNTGIEFLFDKAGSIMAEADYISPYRADVYGIESIRSETFKQDRMDNKSDNDTFVIEVDPVPVAGFYKPFRPVGIIQGVDDPAGMYNILLSPGRDTGRGLSFFRSFIKTGLMRYQTIDKNPALVSNFTNMLPSETIAEASDIALEPDTYKGRDVRALFTPDVIEFECAPPQTLSEIMALHPKGCITFESNGHIFKGFILDVGCTPATNATYTFTLLSHPDNDLSLLIP